MKLRKPHQEEGNIDSWLMSYADMITLLLCFFIIFVSISEPKKDKLSAIAEGMANRFGTVDLATPFEGVLRSLQAVIEEHQILRDVSIDKTETSVEMELSTVTFYRRDSAELNPKMLPVLKELVATLKKIDYVDYRVIVEGYTSDAPPANTALYPTDWELSAAQAARMVRLFIEGGIRPDRVRAVAYGSTHPKVPNLDADGHTILENEAKNQRIVVKLERVM